MFCTLSFRTYSRPTSLQRFWEKLLKQPRRRIRRCCWSAKTRPRSWRYLLTSIHHIEVLMKLSIPACIIGSREHPSLWPWVCLINPIRLKSPSFPLLFTMILCIIPHLILWTIPHLILCTIPHCLFSSQKSTACARSAAIWSREKNCDWFEFLRFHRLLKRTGVI